MHNWLQLSLLLICAVASGMLLLRSTDEPPRKPESARLGLGYYMTDAEVVVTGDDGLPLYRLRTDSAVQQERDGDIVLDKVLVDYDPAQSIPWDLHADSGQIPPDRTMIELEGNVVARTRDDANTPITIRTDYLELNTETYVAETTHKVSIDYSTNQVQATGLRAYFKEDRLQLLADVHGKFYPHTLGN